MEAGVSGIRWTNLAAPLAGVAVLGAGIAMMLRISYIQNPSVISVILPPAAGLIGSLLLLVPLLRRLAREDTETEEADRQFDENRPPRSFYGHEHREKQDSWRRPEDGSRN